MTPKDCQKLCENNKECKGFMFVSKYAPKRDPSCILKRKLKNEMNHENGQIISGPAKCPDPPGKFYF